MAHCCEYAQEFEGGLKVVKVEADPCPNLVEKYKVISTFYTDFIVNRVGLSLRLKSTVPSALLRSEAPHPSSKKASTPLCLAAGVWASYSGALQGWRGREGQPERGRPGQTCHPEVLGELWCPAATDSKVGLHGR